MLVQHRGVGESLVIGKAGDVLEGPIVITVVHAKKLHTRLGVTAPRRIGVFREEKMPLLPEKDASDASENEELQAATLLGDRLPIVGTGIEKPKPPTASVRGGDRARD